MEENKTDNKSAWQMPGHPTGCQCYGCKGYGMYGHGHSGYFALRLLVKILIAVIIFFVGFKLGQLSGGYRYGAGFRHHGYYMMTWPGSQAYPGMQGQAQPTMPNTAHPTTGTATPTK